MKRSEWAWGLRVLCREGAAMEHEIARLRGLPDPCPERVVDLEAQLAKAQEELAVSHASCQREGCDELATICAGCEAKLRGVVGEEVLRLTVVLAERDAELKRVGAWQQEMTKSLDATRAERDGARLEVEKLKNQLAGIRSELAPLVPRLRPTVPGIHADPIEAAERSDASGRPT